MNKPTLVTAPAPHLIYGHLKTINTDMLHHFEEIGAHGDFVKARYLWLSIYYLNHPELIRELFVKNAKALNKPFSLKRISRSYTDENIFISDGDIWKKQRKLMQPAFNPRRIEAYAEDMVTLTKEMISNWQLGNSIDIVASMADLTMRIIIKTMFTTEIDDLVKDIGPTIAEIFDRAAEDLTSPSIFLPLWLPTKRNKDRQERLEKLRPIYTRLMKEWRQKNKDQGDLLSALMMARYDDGTPMDDEQIMSELNTIFLAGHETTSKTLTFAMILLAQHKSVATELYQEVKAVLGDRPPTLADIPQLTFCKNIIKETMRLYPAAIAASREANEEIPVGTHKIKKGEGVSVNIWHLHRDERWYPEPLSFKPARWTEQFESELHKYAYLPFGAGPRICIGNHFAMMESVLILATIAQQFDLQLERPFELKPTFRFTLHPGPDQIPMQVNGHSSL